MPVPEPVVVVAKVDVNDQHGVVHHEQEKDTSPLAEPSIHHEEDHVHVNLNESKEEEQPAHKHEHEEHAEGQINIVDEVKHEEAVHHPEIPHVEPVKISESLILDARLASEVFERSLAGPDGF